MKVPDDCLPGFASWALNAGLIAGIDFDVDRNNHFQLKLHMEQGIYYAMRYDAVVCYTDEMYCSFSLFCLPAYALHDPSDNAIEVERGDKDGDDDDNNEFIPHPSSSTQQIPPPK
jgi:hypothetical protein